MISIIEQQVSIKPEDLDNNIKNNILEALKKLIKDDECSYKNGYILSINKIKTFTNNYISSATNMIVFTVVFEAFVLNPKVDDIIEGLITVMHSAAVFIEIEGKIKVLISDMSGLIYNSSNEEYILDNNIIKKGDKISVKITDIRYQNKKISCIGKLII